MKRTVILLCVLVFSSIGQAQAEMGDHFYLLKGGLMWVDASDDPDSLTTLGLTYGYGLTERFSLEIDYDRSISGGAYTTVSNGKGEYKIWLASADFTYRHLLFSGVYLKAKAGYMYGNQERTNDFSENQDDDIQGLNGSLSLGYLAGAVLGSSTTVELSYTWHKQDITSAMLGVNVTF